MVQTFNNIFILVKKFTEERFKKKLTSMKLDGILIDVAKTTEFLK